MSRHALTQPAVRHRRTEAIVKHLTLIAACALLLGCADEEPISAPTTPAFVLFGSVRDSAGEPIAGATAQITDGTFRGRVAFSNQGGYFKFVQVSGPMTISVWKDGYDFSVVRDLMVSADLALDVTLARIEFSDSIILGQLIRSNVLAGAPPCDPVHWDAHAPCRRFSFTAPASGRLLISVTWSGGSPLDAVIMSPEGAYLETSEEWGPGVEKVTVGTYVQEGLTYEIRISSYYDAQVFNLIADLITDMGASR